MSTHSPAHTQNHPAADARADPLADRLSYHDNLPLTWTPLSAPLPPERLLVLQDQNLRVLAVVASLEERHKSRGDSDEHLEQEIARLHQKIDMLLVLFGAFLRRMDPPAPVHAVRLSGAGIHWETAPPPEGSGLLSLYLHPCMPEPFSWPAQVLDAAGGICRARFEPLGEALEAALDKHVFLHHRRSVAGSRPSSGRPG